jgi:spore coat polysaccharide biosynthesis protein SpsF
MKTVFLITARLKSKRLKKKIFKEINRKPMIYYMIQRLKSIKEIDNIIICTSKTKEDYQIVDFCKKYKVDYYRGSSKDVILRLKDASEYFNAKYIINIPADNPLVDPIYIKKTISLIKTGKYDLIRNYSIPIGLFCYGMTLGSLKKVCDIKKSNLTEVWYKYYSETRYFKIFDIKPIRKHSEFKARLTVDYIEDFLLIKKVILYFKKNLNFNINDLIKYFKKYPKDLNINKHLNQKTKSRYIKQSAIKLKKNIKFKKYNKKYNDFIDYKL